MDGPCHTTASGKVSNAYWNRDAARANLDRDDPDNRDVNYGVRSGMRVDEGEMFNIGC